MQRHICSRVYVQLGYCMTRAETGVPEVIKMSAASEASLGNSKFEDLGQFASLSIASYQFPAQSQHQHLILVELEKYISTIADQSQAHWRLVASLPQMYQR